MSSALRPLVAMPFFLRAARSLATVSLASAVGMLFTTQLIRCNIVDVWWCCVFIYTVPGYSSYCTVPG